MVIYWHISNRAPAFSVFAHFCPSSFHYSTALILPPQLSEEGERYTFMESESDKLLKSLRHQSDARYMYFFIQPVYPPDYSAFISKPSEFVHYYVTHCLISLFMRKSCQWLLQWINNPQFNLALQHSHYFSNSGMGCLQ